MIDKQFFLIIILLTTITGFFVILMQDYYPDENDYYNNKTIDYDCEVIEKEGYLYTDIENINNGCVEIPKQNSNEVNYGRN